MKEISEMFNLIGRTCVPVKLVLPWGCAIFYWLEFLFNFIIFLICFTNQRSLWEAYLFAQSYLISFFFIFRNYFIKVFKFDLTSTFKPPTSAFGIIPLLFATSLQKSVISILITQCFFFFLSEIVYKLYSSGDVCR